MSSSALLRLSFFVAVIVAALHTLAVTFFLYWHYWWFDNILHFLGGLCLGFASLGIFFLYRKSRVSPKPNTVLLVALISVLIVGGVWEIFEYCNGFTDNSIGSYPLDVVKDLTFGVIGSYVAYRYSLKSPDHKL
ncbi:MAG: hypothetical protein V4467_02210 [Patescibacteria group bacterium]